MEFHKSETSVLTQGDIQQNNVSIDTSNINFIVTILSSNLYSNPLESFIRETTSNAWDSHVEAGNEDPIVMALGKDSEGNFYCRVTDFGVGLSPERFDKIYRNIGSSTKRGDNSQIGGFGIGRFSALAYSDHVRITSRYDGKEYLYLMYKDGNAVSIDLLNTIDTDQPNGLSVEVPVNGNDLYRFVGAAEKQLSFFENLYFDGSELSEDEESVKDMIDDFNSGKVRRYNNFYVSSEKGGEISLLLGKVNYPLRISNLNHDYPQWIQDLPISIKLNIGDLEVTPNREEILYTEKNIDTINTVLQAAIQEVKDLFANQAVKDYTSLFEYKEALKHKTEYDFIQDPDQKKFLWYTLKDANKNITLNGETYDQDIFLGTFEAVYDFQNRFTHYTDGYKLSKGNGTISFETFVKYPSRIVAGRVSEWGAYTKSYIKDVIYEERLNDSSADMYIFNPIRTKSEFMVAYRRMLTHCKKHAKNSVEFGYTRKWKGFRAYHFDKRIFKLIFNNLLKNLRQIPIISNYTVPDEYIEKKKKEAKLNRAKKFGGNINWAENMNMYRIEYAQRGWRKITTTAIAANLGELKRFHGGLVIYSPKGDSDRLRDFSRIILENYDLKKEIACVEIAPTKIKHLKHISNFVDFETMLLNPQKYRILSKIATAVKIREELPFLKDLYCISPLRKILPPDVYLIMSKLYSYQKKYLDETFYSNSERKETKAIIQEITGLVKDAKCLDYTTLAQLNSVKDILYKCQFIMDFNTVTVKEIPFIIDYILARKLFRPNIETMNKIKNQIPL